MSRFSETLREHAQYPNNMGILADADAVGKCSLNGYPPFVTFYVKASDNRISAIRFTADGCGVTIAACSALTCIVEDMPLSNCFHLNESDIVAELDGVPPDKSHSPTVALAGFLDAISQLKNGRKPNPE